MEKEQLFNINFNQHKANVDIGIQDNDAKAMSMIYGIPQNEVEELLERNLADNQRIAEKMKSNACIAEISAEKPFRIAMLGDSITSYRLGYRCIMKEVLKSYHNIVVGDFSVSGYKVNDLFTLYYRGIQDFAPDAATIMIGTNDMCMTDDPYLYTHTPIEHFVRDYDYLLRQLKSIHASVLSITLPPFCMEKIAVAFDGWHMLYRQDVMDRFNDAIIKTAMDNDVNILDMREVYQQYDPAALTLEDGIHLNSIGHEILAEKVLCRLAEML